MMTFIHIFIGSVTWGEHGENLFQIMTVNDSIVFRLGGGGGYAEVRSLDHSSKVL
jgi:hypothetical protein